MNALRAQRSILGEYLLLTYIVSGRNSGRDALARSNVHSRRETDGTISAVFDSTWSADCVAPSFPQSQVRVTLARKMSLPFLRFLNKIMAVSIPDGQAKRLSVYFPLFISGSTILSCANRQGRLVGVFCLANSHLFRNEQLTAIGSIVGFSSSLF